jgi:hypothetical protein
MRLEGNRQSLPHDDLTIKAAASNLRREDLAFDSHLPRWGGLRFFFWTLLSVSGDRHLV